MERLIISGSKVIGLIAALMVATAAWMVVGYAPVEKIQGPIQKIMYLHVSSALASYVAVGVVALCGGLYLWQRKNVWDRMARSAAELAVVYCGIVLITGPLWGRPVWGVFWVWDARLTFTLVLFLIFVAYFLVRSLVGGEQGARFSAIIGIVGLVDVPFINIAAEKFRTLHPPNVMKGGMTAEMGVTLTFSILTMLVVFAYLLSLRLRVAQQEDRVHGLRASLVH